MDIHGDPRISRVVIQKDARGREAAIPEAAGGGGLPITASGSDDMSLHFVHPP